MPPLRAKKPAATAGAKGPRPHATTTENQVKGQMSSLQGGGCSIFLQRGEWRARALFSPPARACVCCRRKARR